MTIKNATSNTSAVEGGLRNLHPLLHVGQEVVTKYEIEVLNAFLAWVIVVWPIVLKYTAAWNGR